MDESKMKKLRSAVTALVCIAVLFSFFVSIIRVFGFRVYGVLSGSMEPAYPIGSLIYVRDVNADDLRIGDAITFSLSPNVIATHRIVGIVPDESNPAFRRFQTKGDANRTVDSSLVSPSNIIGKVAFSLPYLGTIANYIQNPPGRYVAILIGAVLIGLVIMTDTAASKKLPFFKKKEAQQAMSVGSAPNAQPPQMNYNAMQQRGAGVQQPFQSYPVQHTQTREQAYTYAGQFAAGQPQYRSQQSYHGYPQQMPVQPLQQQTYPGYGQRQGIPYPQQGAAYRQPQPVSLQRPVTQSAFSNNGNMPVQVQQVSQRPVPPQQGADAPRRRRSGNQQV